MFFIAPIFFMEFVLGFSMNKKPWPMMRSENTPPQPNNYVVPYDLLSFPSHLGIGFRHLWIHNLTNFSDTTFCLASSVSPSVLVLPSFSIVQLEASMHQGLEQHMPSFNLPSKILCKVVNVQLRVSYLLLVIANSLAWVLQFLMAKKLLPLHAGRTWNRWSLCSDNFGSRSWCQLLHYLAMAMVIDLSLETDILSRLSCWNCFVSIFFCMYFWLMAILIFIPLFYAAKWDNKPRSSTFRTWKVHHAFILQDSYGFWHKYPWWLLCFTTSRRWLFATSG